MGHEDNRLGTYSKTKPRIERDGLEFERETADAGVRGGATPTLVKGILDSGKRGDNALVVRNLQ
jgi:hypothetical protein